MAKNTFQVKAKGSREYFEKVKRALNDAVKISVMKNLGKTARELVYNRTKSGYGVNDDEDQRPDKTKLLRLSPSYIKLRSKFSDLLGPGGKPRKSNLTFTGQMLDSIEVEARRNGFTLKIPNTVRDDNAATNAWVADQVRKYGRPFFALTAAEQVVLFRILEKSLRDELKKILGSKSVR